MNIILNDLQKVSLSIEVTDAMGNMAVVDGKPVWVSSDETIVTLVVSEDGYSVEAITVGKLGQCQISVSVDADVSEGIRNLTGVADLTVVGSEAANLVMSMGIPENR
jgi:hypothetical protein